MGDLVDLRAYRSRFVRCSPCGFVGLYACDLLLSVPVVLSWLMSAACSPVAVKSDEQANAGDAEEPPSPLPISPPRVRDYNL
jgi:hypothetical protein